MSLLLARPSPLVGVSPKRDRGKAKRRRNKRSEIEGVSLSLLFPPHT